MTALRQEAFQLLETTPEENLATIIEFLKYRSADATEKRRKILSRFVDEVKKIYDKNLKKVILYGSYARGDFRDYSDIDVLVLLDFDEETLQKQKKELPNMTYDFNTENNIEISALAESYSQYVSLKNIHPLYQNIEIDGVILYANQRCRDIERRFKNCI